MFSWIANSIWETTSEALKQGYDIVKTETREKTNALYSRITTSFETPAPKNTEVIEDIKERHQARKAAYHARNTIESEATKQQLAEYKLQLTQILDVVNKEISGLTNSYLYKLYQNQIHLKCTEKKVLNCLLCAKTFAELTNLATLQKQLLEKAGSKNKAIYSLLNTLDNNASSQLIHQQAPQHKKTL